MRNGTIIDIGAEVVIGAAIRLARYDLPAHERQRLLERLGRMVAVGIPAAALAQRRLQNRPEDV